MIETLEPRLLMAIVAVLNNNDSGAGSLRAAIASASENDTIDLTDRSGQITLTSGQLTVDKNLTFLGPGASALTISGNNTFRAFFISSGEIVSMSAFTIAEGFAHSGAGISNNGTLALDGVVVRDSVADAEGGGIDSNGLLTLTDCSILNNVSRNVGAGINVWQGVTMTRCTVANNLANAVMGSDPNFGDSNGFGRGGGLSRYQGITTITNCTFTGNTASGETQDATGKAQGGAIYVISDEAFTMLNCTIAGNIASADDASGGGVYLGAGSGTRSFTNTIIADNTASTGESDFDTEITATSGGNNLIGRRGTSDVFTNGVNGDKVGTNASPINAKLADLGDNGGETPTLALLTGSPAINAGKTSAAPATDQRGQARVGQADIGAFEFSSSNAAPQITSVAVTSVFTRQAYVYGITAGDANDDALTISAQNLPAWLILTDHQDGTASLVGTPGVLDAGSFNVTVKVSDGLANDQQSFTINSIAPRYQLLNDGVLVIVGGDNANQIQAWVRVENQLRVIRDGEIRNFDAGAVSRVEIWGMAGDDTITINTRTIAAYVAAGDGLDAVYCGDESDTVSGGSGKDLIYGGGGHDRLNGNGSSDRLVGGSGLDRLYGGAGNDRLVGSEDGDQLRGDDGDDILYADGDNAADLLIGGDGNDSAYADDMDVKVDDLTLLA